MLKENNLLNKDPIEEFNKEISMQIKSYKNDIQFQDLSSKWMLKAFEKRYMYNFSSLGRPHIQLPTDIVAVQEIIWKVKPDLIIETGIAHGGSVISSASMLALLDYCDAVEHKELLDPSNPKRKVIAIDIDIREHNKKKILQHPMSNRIELIQGSSVDENIISIVKEKAKKYKNVMVFLDSMHTHNHVLAELKAYANLVSLNSYCIVFDTIIEHLPDKVFSDRPWSIGNSPKTALTEFLKHNKDFIIDSEIHEKLIVTVAPDGFLKRIK